MHKSLFSFICIFTILLMASCNEKPIEMTTSDGTVIPSETGREIRELEKKARNENTRYQAQVDLVKIYLSLGEIQIIKRQLAEIPEVNKEIAALYMELFKLYDEQSAKTQLSNNTEKMELLNSLSEEQQAILRPPMPVFSLLPGEYEEPALILSPDFEKLGDGKLYVTFDGSDPYEKALSRAEIYETPNGIKITENGEYKVRAVVLSQTYNFDIYGIPSREFSGKYTLKVTPKEEINFTNPLIEKYVRYLIRKPEGAIYDSDLAKISTVNLNTVVPNYEYDNINPNDYYTSYWEGAKGEIHRVVNGEIIERYSIDETERIEGPFDDLKYFTGAESLSFTDDEIKDFSFIKNMPLLKNISFNSGNIVLNQLSGFPQIRDISISWLDDNVNINLKQLAEIPNLYKLGLREVTLDMTGMKEFDPTKSKITQLYIFGINNDLSEFLPFKETLIQLYVDSLKESNGQSLSEMKNLRFLSYDKSKTDDKILNALRKACPQIREWHG